MSKAVAPGQEASAAAVLSWIKGPRAGVAALLAVGGAGKTLLLRYALEHWHGPTFAVDLECVARGLTRPVKYLHPGRGITRQGIKVGDPAHDWRQVPRGGLAHHWCLDAVNMARAYGITLVWTAREPVAVHYEVTGCSRLWIVGFQSDMRHLAKLTEKRPDAPAVVRKLDPGKEGERCGQFARFRLW